MTQPITVRTDASELNNWRTTLNTMIGAVLAQQYLETVRASNIIEDLASQLKTAAETMNTNLKNQSDVVRQHIGNSDLPYQQELYNNAQLQGQAAMTPLQNGIDQAAQVQSDIESAVSTAFQLLQSLLTIPQNTVSRTGN